MRQVHRGTRLGQRVRRPVPAVGALQHDLGRLTGPGHHRGQPLPVVDDPDGLQRLAGLGRPHQHRTTPVQVDTDDPCLPAWSSLTGASFVVRT
jgi:hypothetical protein